jgi:hypothetical protein
MNMRHIAVVAAFAASALAFDAAGAVEWRNLDPEHQLAGRKTSEGYLKGKVVLVHRWEARSQASLAMLPQIEQIWQSFKTKPFVVLGGLKKGRASLDEITQTVKEHGLTYPIYEDAGLAYGEPGFDTMPFLYVVDSTGRVIYRGTDDKKATQGIVTALTDMAAPRNVGQWKKFLDFELKELPGHALVRLEELREKFPDEAKKYDAEAAELKKIKGMKKLVELVKYARQAKDMRPFGERQTSQRERFARKLDNAIRNFAPLAQSDDPRVAQEAKNAIADLKWTRAGL